MDQQSNIKVNVDLKQAIKDFELLDQRVDETVDSIQSMESTILRLEKEQKALGPKQVNRYKDYTKAIDKAKQKLKEEKQDLKQLNTERKRAKKTIDENKDAQKDYSGATSIADRATGGLLGSLTQMKSALGGVTKGLGKVKIAWIATGIGLFVVLLTSLYAALTRSEEGQDMMTKGLAVLGAVVNQIMDVFADFGEAVINAFKNPKEAWESFKKSLETGWEFIKKQIVDRFQGSWAVLTGNIEAGILKMRIAWNEWTGDAEEAQQLTEELEKVQQKVFEGEQAIKAANQAIADGFQAAADKVKEFAAETQKEMEQAAAIADKKARADRIDRQLIVDRAEATRKFNELREKAADKENVSIEDRIAALKEAGRIEEEITRKEIAAAKLRFEAKKEENAMGKSTKEDLDEQAQLQATLIDLEAKRLKRQKTLTAEITTNLREEASERKRIAAEFEKNFQYHPIYGFISKEAMAAAQKDLEGIDKIQAEYAKKLQDEAVTKDSEKLELEKERKLKELDDLNATEEQKAGIVAYYGDKIAKQKKKEQDDEAKREKLVQAAKLNMAKNALMNISKALGENSKAGKAAAAAAALINTYQGITAELATKTVTPWEFAVKIINVASTAAIGFKSVKDILKTNPKGTQTTGSTPSGGRGASAQAPSFNVVGAGASSQLASALAEQETPPVQAYVVSQDVTTAQSLERNIVEGGTIGG